MSDYTLNIEALATGQVPHARVLIGTPKGTVSGFTTESVTLSGASQWEGKEAGHLEQLDEVARLAHSIGSVAGMTTSQMSLTSMASTRKHWLTSESPSIPLNFLIVAYKSGIDVRKKVATLLSTVYPAGSAASIAGVDLFLKAPNNYKFTGLNSASGLLSLKIGNWFDAQGLLMEDVSATFSKEITQDGTPLYAEISCTFTPWKLLTAEDAIAMIQ
ncbi:hypothetical protein CWB96_00355 [Pseudoalteromonas citrea]|uniref:Phage tail protein n=1 Tax=Pseudoalteromonas citrea TaxID=43655 RepID=A0A5S3XVI8_9GAMM|nr:hypothetical protein [Pseudoalteromonas citrea]TMP46318.1 hypothetical protein CWB97_02350 [Pseudoalteromonas citrea]TMP63094.1 hypothetical protein CWB96_00355 [Pseudoalteromonas citrea]